MIRRREQIVALINEEGQISFSKLKESFPDISDMTLRTDLKYLDEMGKVIRIHGGARSVETLAGTDGLYLARATRKQSEKLEIAQKAVNLLPHNATLFIDSGSTTTLFCRTLPDAAYEIYTCGISCATELSRLSQPKVHLLGGEMNRYSLSVAGPQAVLQAQNYHFDICILGTTSFSPEFGFSCESEADCFLKRIALSHTRHVMVLMDSGKYGLINTHRICTAEQIDILVSDHQLSQEQKQFFTAKGISVY